MYKTKIFFLLILLLSPIQFLFASPSEAEVCSGENCIENSYKYYRDFIKERLSHYNANHPDIFFIHLPNHDEWIDSIIALEMLLGYQSISLDFDHPPELAQDLLYVTVARIQKMLLYGHSAAFLFKRGVQAVAKRENICVITMNPEAIASSPLSATSYMLAVPVEKLETLSKGFQLDGTQLLEFIIDHEAGHCLDSYYNGAVPMSPKELWGQFKHYQREMFADSYAMSKHIQQYGKESNFIGAFINLRKLCLINGDPGTCTGNIITQLVHTHGDNFSRWNETERIKSITDFNHTVSYDYDQFVNYLFSSIQVMQQLNIDLDESCCDLKKPKNYQIVKQLITELLENTKSSYRHIFNAELKSPHLK